MNRRLITKIVMYTFIVPTTVASLPWLIIGALFWPVIVVALIYSGGFSVVLLYPLKVGLNPGNYSISELVPVTVPLGIWGLYTLWVLTVHYLNNDSSPPKVLSRYSGLFAGFAAAIQIMVNTFSQPNRGGVWMGCLLILALLAGFYFLLLMLMSNNPNATNARAPRG